MSYVQEERGEQLQLIALSLCISVKVINAIFSISKGSEKHIFESLWALVTWIAAAICFTMCLADPATFLASNSVLGEYFLLRTACLFSYGNMSEFALLLKKCRRLQDK